MLPRRRGVAGGEGVAETPEPRRPRGRAAAPTARVATRADVREGRPRGNAIVRSAGRRSASTNAPGARLASSGHAPARTQETSAVAGRRRTSAPKEALLWRSEHRDARGHRVAILECDATPVNDTTNLVDKSIAVRAPRSHGHGVRLDGLAALEVARAPDVRRERVLLRDTHIQLARVLGDALAVDAAHVE